jgi:hypothetical protein
LASASVDNDNPFRVSLSQKMIAFSDPFMEIQIFFLEPTHGMKSFSSIPGSSAFQTQTDLQVKEQRQIRFPNSQTLDKLLDPLETDAASVTLVGKSGVVISIAQDN